MQSSKDKQEEIRKPSSVINAKKSPVQVLCTILDAWVWCTGMTQRESMGREEGGGFWMGNTGIPVADSFQCLAKVIKYCKA